MPLHRILKFIPRYPITISFYLLLVGWTIIIIGIIYWSYQSIYSETLKLAQREAYKGYEKDVMFRSWATSHGGVYVPVSNETQPNPYLINVAERDITTPSGRKLTLMNPAYITRQVHELSFQKLGIRGHITSLNPIRKENAPDKWEIAALNSFQKGVKEVHGFDYINNKKYFRYMAPLITEKGCLKCHAKQGYKVGDIRGGISSTVSWSTYEASLNAQGNKIFIGYGILWIIGFVGISAVRKRFIIYITRRDLYEEEMKKLNEELYSSRSIIEENLVERNSFIDEITVVNNELQKSNNEKDKFFSIIAHDLRNPFIGFMGLTELLADESQNLTKEELVTMSRELNSSARNLFKLLQNLLEWSQMQQGSVNFNPSKILISEIVKQNISLLEQRIQQKSITVEFKIDEHLYVYADENMFNSIVRNLIGNALKFTKSGGSIILSANEVENDMIEICVEDTGIGMPPQILENLFKIDKKVGRLGIENEKSSGLGLLLCKEFVDTNGGRIWVESEEGKGSKFYFTLPNEKIHPK